MDKLTKLINEANTLLESWKFDTDEDRKEIRAISSYGDGEWYKKGILFDKYVKLRETGMDHWEAKEKILVIRSELEKN